MNDASKGVETRVHKIEQSLEGQERFLAEVKEYHTNTKKLIQNSESRIKLMVDNPLERHEQEMKLLKNDVTFLYGTIGQPVPTHLKSFEIKIEEPPALPQPIEPVDPELIKPIVIDSIDVDTPQTISPAYEMDIEVDSAGPVRTSKRKRSTSTVINKKHKS